MYFQKLMSRATLLFILMEVGKSYFLNTTSVNICMQLKEIPTVLSSKHQLKMILKPLLSPSSNLSLVKLVMCNFYQKYLINWWFKLFLPFFSKFLIVALSFAVRRQFSRRFLCCFTEFTQERQVLWCTFDTMLLRANLLSN